MFRNSEIKKTFQKKKNIETHAHFERPCIKLKNCNFVIENTKIKIGKSEKN